MTSAATSIEERPPNAAIAPTSLTFTPGALVVGGDYQGLGIVRSLGQRSIPVIVLDDERSVSRWSRYCKSFIKVPSLQDEEEIVQRVLEIGHRFQLHGWVLYPTREELVAAFSRRRSELSEVFRVPTPPWECVRWAWDKRNTYRLAQDLGIPVPRTYYVSSDDKSAQLEDIAPPFAIKPAIKEHFFYATKAKAWKANSHAELKMLFRKAAALAGPGEIMVQEVIPGGGAQQFSYCAFFRGGEGVAKMVVQRRRQHPLEFGRASTYVTTVHVPVLESLSERFLREIDYYGLVEMEYKFDARDNQFKLLDVNARTWGYHSLGSQAGVDFSYMLYADQIGQHVTPCTAQHGVSWVRMVTDLPAAAIAMLHGDLDLATYIRSIASCSTDAVLSARDPLPGFVELMLLPYLALTKGF